MSADEQGAGDDGCRGAGSPRLFAACAAIALVVFAMHEVRGAFRCESDTSYCAESRDQASV